MAGSGQGGGPYHPRPYISPPRAGAQGPSMHMTLNVRQEMRLVMTPRLRRGLDRERILAETLFPELAEKKPTAKEE